MSLTILFLYVLTAFLITLFLVKYILYKIKINKMMKKVKILDGELPIIGHTLYTYTADLKMKNSQDLYNLIEDHLGGVKDDRRYWIMNYHFFVAVKEKTIEKILTSPDAVEKSYMYSSFSYLMNGIFIAPTQKWRKMRKRLNMTFNPKFFSNYIDQMNHHAKIFTKVQQNKQNTNHQDILPLASKYFFDVISSTHFGVNTKQQFRERSNVAEEVSRGTEFVYERLMRPWLHIDALFEKTKLYHRMKEAMEPCKPFLERLMAMSAEYQKRTDLLGNSLGWKSYSLHCTELFREMGLKPSTETIGNSFSDLLVAGSDTASVAMSNLLYQLGRNPHYQALAFEEIMTILEDASDGTDIHCVLEEQINGQVKYNGTKPANGETNPPQLVNSENESATEMSEQLDNVNDWTFISSLKEANTFWTRARLDRLQYIEMLIKESLRLCSPPMIVRYLHTDIDTGEYTIPKGTNVAILAKNIQRNPLYWEKPNEFYPEHFKPEMVKARPKFSYLPFSHGPRDCPGKVFGLYGMKCLLVEIIKNFIIETEPRSTATNFKLVFMIEQMHGYPIKLIPRQK